MKDGFKTSPLPVFYRSEDKGDVWHLYCRVCNKGWSLKKTSTAGGNLLQLMNHALSHQEK